MIKLKELIDTNALGGDKIKIDDVLNKPIILTGASVSNSKYKGKGSDYYSRLRAVIIALLEIIVVNGLETTI